MCKLGRRVKILAIYTIYTVRTYMTVSIFLVAIFGTDFYMAANSELREERGVGRAKGEKVRGIQGVGR